MHIQMCSAEGTPLHHEIGDQAMVYVGRVEMTAEGDVSLIPCRGITQRQARQLYRAWLELLDDDVWESCCVGGWVTHVSIPALGPSEPCLPPLTVGFRALRRSAWRGSRGAHRIVSRRHPCPNVNHPGIPEEECPGDRPLVGD
jgi:hypothetical protein